MSINLELENDEFAHLFFYLQSLNEKSIHNPVLEKVVFKMENTVFSRFSIEEIEEFRKIKFCDTTLGEIG